MNIACRQLFNYLTRPPQSAVSNTARVLGLHNGCVNMAEVGATKEFDRPGPAVSPPTVQSNAPEPDKLYKLIELEMKANQKQILNSYEKFLTMAAEGLGVTIGERWGPARPTHHRYTVLRSAFVHKRCRVQYEYRTYYRYMSFPRVTGSTADTFLEYVERNLPEGLGLKVTKVAVEAAPEHLVPSKKDSPDESAS